MKETWGWATGTRTGTILTKKDLLRDLDIIQRLYDNLSRRCDMSTITVNISFQDRLLADIDRIAHRESRSRSELLREAARLYIGRQERWGRIFSTTASRAKKLGLSEKDVLDEIALYRREKRKQHVSSKGRS